MKKIFPFFAMAFSGFSVYLFDKIWGDSINWQNLKLFKIGELLTIKIELYRIIIFIGLLLLLFLIRKKIVGDKESHYSRNQKKLRKCNSSRLSGTNILMRWNVYFHNHDTPFITNLTFFCEEHDGSPIRFIYNRCPVQGCKNNRPILDEFAIKNQIESDLIDKWEKTKDTS